MKWSCALLGLWISIQNNDHAAAFRPVVIKPRQRTKTFSSSSTSSSTPPQQREFPDYGKTPVEIDTIRLEKAKPWRRKDLFGNSLMQQTLQQLEEQQQQQGPTLPRNNLNRSEQRQRHHRLSGPSFAKFLTDQGLSQLQRTTPTVLQINIGLLCNQACQHCHVESSPLRLAEQMTAETAAQCLKLLAATPSIRTLDITGGAPELNGNFRTLIRMARLLRGPQDLEIIDRCNLTILQEPGQEDLIDFLKEHQVRIVASLPCYSAENVNQQRGYGVFERSIAALLALNDAGYGLSEHLKLDLVYNPLGPFLPPPQEKLQEQYKKVLHDNFGILFHSLFTITNMPIQRFANFLQRRGELEDYMDLLVRNFNPQAIPKLMCHDLVSVGWDGKIYDCDFNQQLGYQVVTDDNDDNKDDGLTVFDIETLELPIQDIRVGNHCFGCTAGMGSSCQGTTAS